VAGVNCGRVSMDMRRFLLPGRGHKAGGIKEDSVLSKSYRINGGGSQYGLAPYESDHYMASHSRRRRYPKNSSQESCFLETRLATSRVMALFSPSFISSLISTNRGVLRL